MLAKDQGIVIKTMERGETSKVVTLLAQGAGKIRLLAKGARKGPSPGPYEPGTVIEVVYYHREGRDLFYVKEAAVIHRPPPAATLEQAASLLAALELLDRVSYPGAPAAELVELAREFLLCPPAKDPLLLLLAFAYRLLGLLGVAPHLEGCFRCGVRPERFLYDPREGVGYCPDHAPTGARFVALARKQLELAERIGSSLERTARVEVEREDRKLLGRLVHETYTFHVQGYRLPKALELLVR